MTNWHSPSLIFAENVAFVKLVHAVGGVYIWEFVWSLGYEYSIMTGRRKFTWSFLPYIAARWFALILTIVEFVALDTSLNMTCRAMMTSDFVLGSLTLLSASTLVILRAVALWEKSKVIIAMGCTLWLANATTYIYGISISAFRGLQINGVCMFIRSSHASILVLSTFITDLILLALMLLGALRWRNSRRGRVWWLLYRQGLAWVAIFTLAGLPGVIFVILDLNEPMYRMFIAPQCIFVTICASRMHLALSEALQ